jgi:CheY-like chemotaxis protein
VRRGCDDDGMPATDRDPRSAPGDAEPLARVATRALVVEDEVEMTQVIGSYLEREGFEVHLSHDGVDAVARAREVDPDIVVLDLGLPGQDGLKVCRQLRTFSDAYVVMLTARTDEVDTLIGLSVGADDYLTKPFSPRELVARRGPCSAAPDPSAPPPRTRQASGCSAP